jgi:hypothetical protein
VVRIGKDDRFTIDTRICSDVLGQNRPGQAGPK